MIGLLKNKSQYYTEKHFFYVEIVFSTQEFCYSLKNYSIFTQEILSL